MDYSQQQLSGIKAILKWFKTKPRKPYFFLAGYAGTGKSTLAKEIAKHFNNNVEYCAFTGKAAQVMRKKGCLGAQTIHSLIYNVIDNDDDGTISFELNSNSNIRKTKLIIIDECSMVGKELAEDLLSFGKPILVLGDPAQLPPVGDTGYFTNGEPDYMLTEVHRQAQDNPIIAMSMAVREKELLPEGNYGECKVVSKDKFDLKELEIADQIICGKNVTRNNLNEALREIKGFSESYPMVGERLVCLKNNRKKGLLNGSLWEVVSVKKRYHESTKLLIKSLDNPNQSCLTVYIHDKYFSGKEEEIDWKERVRYDPFTWGYCLTGHKCQGSEFDYVIIFDESKVFREDKHRWLYTAITRASEKLTLVI